MTTALTTRFPWIARWPFFTIIAISAALGIIVYLTTSDTPSTDTQTGESMRTPLVVSASRVSEQHSIAFDFSAAGTVEHESEAHLSASLSGTIVFVGSDLGRAVGVGQTLFRIDSPGSSIPSNQGFRSSELESAALSLANAKKAYQLAKHDDDRDGTTASETAKDQARNNRDIAELAYQAILDRHIVRSPIAGSMTARFVSSGDTVSAGTPLGTISRGKKIVRFSVDDTEHALLSLGQPLSFSKTSDGKNPISGRIIRISPTADAESRRFLIEAESSDSAFKDIASGSIVTVSVSATRQAGPDNFFLPLSAVSQDQDGSAVFTYQDGEARRQAVTLISIDGEIVELSGLDPDTRIITTGVKRLKEGDIVTLEQDRL